MGSVIRTLTADTDGSFVFSNVPSGNYTLYASMAMYANGAIPVNVDIENVANVEIILYKNMSGLSLTLDTSSLYLSVGGGTTSRQLIPTLKIYPEDNQGVTWSSSNVSVATVNADGIVTSVGEGTCTITATSVEYGTNLQATCYVNVRPFKEVEAIILPEFETMTAGLTKTLIPAFLPDDASERNVIWTSSDPSIATVSPTGDVRALASGRVVITCTSTIDSALFAKCKLTVLRLMAAQKTNFANTNNTIITSAGVRSGVGGTSFTASNQACVYYVHFNSNPPGSWISIDVNVPENGNYKVDYIYKSKSDAGNGVAGMSNCVIQCYFGNNPSRTDATFVCDETTIIGEPLDMNQLAQGNMGAIDVTSSIISPGGNIGNHKYLQKTLDESYQLQQGWNTFKMITIDRTFQYGNIAVSVIITPLGADTTETSINLVKEGGKAKANYAIVADWEEGVDYNALIAIYNVNGALVDLKSEIGSVQACRDKAVMLEADLPDGYTAKAFIWDNVTFIPITASKST
jgi:uncharacterized protein YjdB